MAGLPAGTIKVVTASLGLAGTSDAVLAIAFAIIVLLAFFAYGAAAQHRARYGVAPWGLPPWAWSLLVFCFPIILVVFAIALFTTRPRRRPSDPPPVLEGLSEAPPADRFGLGSSHPPPAALPPAGWYPDPSGRHEQRYWDGKGWSEHVSDQGERSLDPG